MVKKALKSAVKKTRSLFSRNWKTIGGIFLMVLMLASVFGGLVLSGNEQAQGQGGQKSSGTHVGVVNGVDVYKIEDTDYFANLGGVEVHFRANPVVASEFKIDARQKLILSSIMNGPGTFDLVTGKRFSKAYILLEPETPTTAKATVAAAEVATALGANRWVPEVAFTRESVQQPDSKVITVSDAQNFSEDAIVFHFAVSEGIPSNATLYTYHTPESKGVSLFLIGRDFQSLDIVSVAVKMFLLGWTG